MAWIARDGAGQLFIVLGGGPHDRFGGFPVYADPPKRKPLTDERIDQITRDRWGTKLLGVMVKTHREYARAVIQAYEGE